MAKQTYHRQTGIINIKKFRDNKITIVGCGAIGSFVAISLAKMGLTKFSLWDFDKIEAHNLPNQFFEEKDIGQFKVYATQRNMEEFNSDCEVNTHEHPFIRKDGFGNSQIVISCVDKMEARKDIFEESKKDKRVQLFIDTRMGGLQGQIYLVDMENKEQIENYEKSLFSSKEAVQMRCTERSIIFTVLGMAALVCSQIIKALKRESIGNYFVLDYSVPQMF